MIPDVWNRVLDGMTVREWIGADECPWVNDPRIILCADINVRGQSARQHANEPSIRYGDLIHAACKWIRVVPVLAPKGSVVSIYIHGVVIPRDSPVNVG